MLSNNIMHILMASILTMWSVFYFMSAAQQKGTSVVCHKSYLLSNNNHCSATQSCQNKVAQQSWISWLTGDSRSSQFHFLDLLELIESMSDDTQTNQTAKAG